MWRKLWNIWKMCIRDSYITQELKEYEEKILGAEDKILVLETKLYNELVIALAEFIPAIQILSLIHI